MSRDPNGADNPEARPGWLARLVERGRVTRVGPGEVVLREGDLVDGIRVVMKGALATTRSSRRAEAAGRQVIRAGSYLGPRVPGQREPAPVGLRAAAESLILELDAAAIQALLAEDLAFGVEVLDAARAGMLRLVEGTDAATAGAKVVAVTGASGGAGTTTAALLMAARGHAAGLETLFLDLHPFFGSSATLLAGPRPTPVLDALEDEALDVPTLRALAARPGGCDALGAPRHPERGEDQLAREVGSLFEVASRAYDLVVVDLPRGFAAPVIEVLDLADELHLYLPGTLDGIVAGTRFLGLLDRLGVPEERVRVVVNRFRRAAGLEPADFRKALGRAAPVLAEDQGQLAKLANLGRIEHGLEDLAAHPLVAVASYEVERCLGLADPVSPASLALEDPRVELLPEAAGGEGSVPPRLPSWALAVMVSQLLLLVGALGGWG